MYLNVGFEIVGENDEEYIMIQPLRSHPSAAKA